MSWHTPVRGPESGWNAANAPRRPIGRIRLVNVGRLMSAAPAGQRPTGTDAGNGTVVGGMDEYDAVSVNVAAKLKNMDPTQRIYAELLLNKVLTYGMLCTLSETSDVVNVQYSADDGAQSEVGKRG